MVLHKSLANTSNTFANKCLGKIPGIGWDEFKTNHRVREIAQQPHISNVTRQKKWKYHGHVLRMDRKRLPKAALL